MSSLAHRDVRTFPNNAALGQYTRVTLSSGYLAAAAAANDEIGVMEDATFSTDSFGSVRLTRSLDTVKMIASGAITQYADVYRAASGKISATPNGKRVGIAMEAASGDGSIIEVLPLEAEAQENLVEAHTSGDTLTAAECYGSIHTNTGASGAITIALPAAVVGMNVKFAVGAAQELRIDPNGSETISLPSTGVPGAAGKYLVADAIGETVNLVCCSAGSWRVFGHTGTWTAEA